MFSTPLAATPRIAVRSASTGICVTCASWANQDSTWSVRGTGKPVARAMSSAASRVVRYFTGSHAASGLRLRLATNHVPLNRLTFVSCMRGGGATSQGKSAWRKSRCAVVTSPPVMAALPAAKGLPIGPYACRSAAVGETRWAT